MAEIKNGNLSPEAFKATIESMPDEVLLAQDLVQQGAIHAVSWLLQTGCTRVTAAQMLDALQENAWTLRMEAVRRGKPSLFERNQTVL